MKKMKKYKNNDTIFTTTKRPRIFQKILICSLLLLLLPSSSGCMDNDGFSEDDQPENISFEAYKRAVGSFDSKSTQLYSYLSCAFGAEIIAKSVAPLLSWIDEKRGKQKNKNNKTIQEDVQKLQRVSFIAPAFLPKTYEEESRNFFHGSAKIENVIESIKGGILNVSLHTFNAYAFQYCSNKFTDRYSKKSNNRVVKTIRELPQSKKTFSRLFIQWGLWRAEKCLIDKYFG